MGYFRLVSKESFKTGISFGLTSGIITTLGLIVGLHSGTHSRVVVLGGIMTIAVADSLSDALGIHIAQEFQQRFMTKQVWGAIRQSRRPSATMPLRSGASLSPGYIP
jgi:hypothetical protein